MSWQWENTITNANRLHTFSIALQNKKITINMNIEIEKQYHEIIRDLMISHYPEVNIKGTEYYISSKSLTVDFRLYVFYFNLDIAKYHQVEKFKGYSSDVRGTWYFPFLMFDIIMRASSGRTYSYPSLRNMKIEKEKDIIALATYMFSCAHIAIKFFDYEYRATVERGFISPIKDLYRYSKS